RPGRDGPWHVAAGGRLRVGGPACYRRAYHGGRARLLPGRARLLRACAARQRPSDWPLVDLRPQRRPAARDPRRRVRTVDQAPPDHNPLRRRGSEAAISAAHPVCSSLCIPTTEVRDSPCRSVTTKPGTAAIRSALKSTLFAT